jgi:hypothetical protein
MDLKRTGLLLLFLALLACLSGYLMSKPSLVGSMGIDIFYRQYKFLKTWWQGALAVFAIFFLLVLFQEIIHNKLPARRAASVHILMLLLALGGLYYTYHDFRHTVTHRWLKERFHIGAYLFWLGWMGISIDYLVQHLLQKKKEEAIV